MNFIRRYRRNAIIFIFSFLSLVFTACENSLTEADFSDTVTSTKDSITLVVKSQDDVIDFTNTSARTLLPGSDSYKDMKFYLWGKNKITGKSIDPVKVVFNPSSDSTTGTINISHLSSTSYELYLGATKTYDSGSITPALSEIKKDLYYIGFATADLRYSSQVIFYLSPYLVSGFLKDEMDDSSASKTTGYGSVSIKFYFPWTFPGGYNVKYGLYDLVKYDLTKNAPEEVRQQYTTDSGTVNPGTEKYLSSIPDSLENAATLSAIKIIPGNYNFTVSFEGYGKRYVWSDIVTILANRETSGAVAIPNIVENPNITAPSGFTASYQEPAYSDDECYPLTFAWTDNSNNETHFQLELLDVTQLDYSIDSNDGKYNANIAKILDTSGTYSLAEKNAAWTAVDNLPSTPCIIYTPEIYGDSSKEDQQAVCTAGSLLVNNTSITYNMYLDRRYLARLCAKNNVGTSDYVYADLSGWYGGAAVTSINLYRIKYNTNGGNFYDSSLLSNVSDVDLYDYSCQVSGIPFAVMNPVNYDYKKDGNSSASLYDVNGTGWTKWLISSPNGSDYSTVYASGYTGYKGLNLFAYFDGRATTSVSVSKDIKVYGGTNENAGVVIAGGTPIFTYVFNDPEDVNEPNTYSFTVSRAQYQSLWFYITNPTIQNSSTIRKYKAYSLTVSEVYGLTNTIDEHTRTVDANYPHFFVDISDETKYPSGKDYWSELVLTPTISPTNKKSIIIRFVVTD